MLRVIVQRTVAVVALVVSRQCSLALWALECSVAVAARDFFEVAQACARECGAYRGIAAIAPRRGVSAQPIAEA